jgi:bacterioferritin-associated ferredoxin
MIVCHCLGVSEREIRSAVRGGASTRREVARSCGAGSRCSGCVPLVAKIVRAELRAIDNENVELLPVQTATAAG